MEVRFNLSERLLAGGRSREDQNYKVQTAILCRVFHWTYLRFIIASKRMQSSSLRFSTLSLAPSAVPSIPALEDTALAFLDSLMTQYECGQLAAYCLATNLLTVLMQIHKLRMS